MNRLNFKGQAITLWFALFLGTKMQSNEKNVAVIILAAGLGTRMKSNKAKVLHEILGVPMVFYVIETARQIAGNDIILVIGHQAPIIRKMVSAKAQVTFALQEKQLGTGHAVLSAMPFLPGHVEDVVILCGDVPLLTSKTVIQFIHDHKTAKRDISILAVEMDQPKGYGRILIDENNNVSGIVEEADASAQQKPIKRINTGIYCAKKFSR